VIPRYHGIDLKFHSREMEDHTVLAEQAAKVREALASA
jgi:hypothetical protein